MVRKRYEGKQFSVTLKVPPHLNEHLEGEEATALIVNALNTCLLALSLDGPWDIELMAWLNKMQSLMRFGAHWTGMDRSLSFH